MPERNDREAQWQKLVNAAFKAANLPEVKEDQLESGTYTNAQIAEKFREDPTGLVILLKSADNITNQASKRSILSLVVDTIEDKKNK